MITLNFVDFLKLVRRWHIFIICKFLRMKRCSVWNLIIGQNEIWAFVQVCIFSQWTNIKEMKITWKIIIQSWWVIYNLYSHLLHSFCMKNCRFCILLIVTTTTSETVQFQVGKCQFWLVLKIQNSVCLIKYFSLLYHGQKDDEGE